MAESIIIHFREIDENETMKPKYLTDDPLLGDLLEAAQRNYLDGNDLCAWAEALLNSGIETPVIIEALVSDDLHWQEVPELFSRMCFEMGVCENPYEEIELLKERIYIEEYCNNLRTGSLLLQKFDGLRKRIGFPEMVTTRILPDNPDGTNDSGHYGMDKRCSHEVLENAVVEALSRASKSVK